MQKVAVGYVLGLTAALYGFVVGKYQVFPYYWLEKRVDELRDFAAGHDLEKNTSVVDKLFNDFGVEPRRFMFNYPVLPDLATRPLEIPGLKSRREAPQIHVSSAPTPGYLAVFGAFDFTDNFWGGILLDATGAVIHTWPLSTMHLQSSKVREELKTLYGVQLYPDGSVIYTESEEGDGNIGAGGGMVKIDACGKILWNNEGEFHHVVAPTADGHVWSFMGRQTDFDHKLARLSAETGAITRVIDMKDVRQRNPRVSIFNLQKDVYALDISHGNDIEELSPTLAPHFPMFRAGDLLISYRTQNLVFVLDPESLQVKWWRIGAWDRQHDADWEADGSMTVFSNNQANGSSFSDVIGIDPATFATRVLVDGAKLQMKSDFNGYQEVSDYGTRVVTSSTQGMVVEVDTQEKLMLSLINNYKAADRKALQISQAARFGEHYFTKRFWKECHRD